MTKEECVMFTTIIGAMVLLFAVVFFTVAIVGGFKEICPDSKIEMRRNK
jgi:hypothetical protein